MNDNPVISGINAALKIGAEEHILDLQKNGHLYCNTIKYFRELEYADHNRRDSREGAHKTEVIENPDAYRFTWNKKTFPGKILSFRIDSFYPQLNNFKLFCLFGFKKDHVTGRPFINKDIQHFGAKVLFINDLDEFVKRVGECLKDLGIDYQCKYVKYYDEKGVIKNLTPFHKPNRFMLQEEFRILIKEKSEIPFSLKIGSIEDISTILDTKMLAELRIERINNFPSSRSPAS